MSELKTRYVALMVYPWTVLEVTSPVYPVGKMDHSNLPGVGYMEVFDSLLELRERHPDVEYIKITVQPVENEE